MLATSFLVVFVNVFVGQCWCATLNPEVAGHAANVPAKPAAQPAHGGCHGHSAVTKNKPAKAAHKHKSSSKHDCCKDKSASLLSSLITPGEKHLLVAAPALLPAVEEYFFPRFVGKWDRTAKVALVPPRHLKPKIPDIRIFIQSLTV
ncbi:hypothetical protein ACFQT0_29310 [Hymenobacter humi]|uniref:Secreted protein n=1 Tax=Hymenobacter humi TaxID=1411620 RepID=A0ABW2UFN1_9BACT